MKYTKLLFLPALTLTLSMADSKADIGISISTADIYGTFTSNENCYFKFLNTGTSQTVQGRIRGYKNNNYIFNREFEIVNGVSGDINIPTKDRITNSGLRLEMTFKDGNGSSQRFDATLYPPLMANVVANKQRVSYGGSVFGISSNIVLEKEIYDFQDTNEYYSIGEANKIDISGVEFEYYPINKYNCSNAYLEILDKSNVYPLINKNKNGYVSFPLKKVTSNNSVHFDFDLSMYVNYRTMEMSQFKKNGFVETNALFLPLGKERLLEDEASRIVIEGSGFNRNTITIPLSFYLSAKLFGSCGESDYCVHGGIRE